MERENLEDIGVDGLLVLHNNMRVLTGHKELITGSSSGCCEYFFLGTLCLKRT